MSFHVVHQEVIDGVLYSFHGNGPLITVFPPDELCFEKFYPIEDEL